MAKVILKDINKIYPNGFQAVYDTSIEIEDREFVILVGPSGCGKSTTLRMVAGLEEISSGDLIIGDKKVNDVHPKDRDIAMVFQNYALYPHMSVYDNMAFGLKMRKTPKDEIDRRVKEAASILHIESLLDRKPKQLSGGQRQRVALGRAIVRKPKVFLFDEPLSNLDAKLRVTMRAEISRLHSQLQATMIYVTHDQIEAMTMADRIVVMKDGYIQQIDSPMHLYNNPANIFVAGFIGSPPMNFHEVTIDGNKAHAEGIDVPFNAAQKAKLAEYNGKNVIIGIRPEDIKNTAAGKSNHLQAVVEVVEPLGAEIQLHVKLDSGNRMIVKAEPIYTYQVGQKVTFGIDIDKVHFFEKDEKVYPNGKTENITII
ncbi:MAG: sn-glycerol-3-phosphate ABC transporter ATP-binding protein UgpC [Spirochaetes bacterium]|nr:sn-glycerol-3-phosphate ABC transporter ATP-binding protein UgpC [Spirochaetota bacterium]